MTHDHGRVGGLQTLFVYGTLMNDALVAQLTGRCFVKHPAVLRGYRKLEPPGGYPYIVSDPDGTVDGLLLDGVDATALRAFDRYEGVGRLYRRCEVAVMVAGAPRRAMTYVGIVEAIARS